MSTLNKTVSICFAAIAAAGLAGCGRIKGQVVNVMGNKVKFIESYYDYSSKCIDLTDADNDRVLTCRNFSSGISLGPGDYTLQVKAEDGTLYSLAVVNNVVSTRFDCGGEYPTIEEMVTIHMGAIVMHNVSFPYPDKGFNKYNVGDVEWCGLKFFEKKAE